MAIDKIFNDANVDGIADNIFGAVNNSVSEVKQMQQRKAAENVQMVVEAFKKIETNITEKFDNVTDVIEKRVLTIKDGRDGSNGSDGRNGRDGKPGRDGVNGKQGPPGTPGKDGTDGVDGVSVTNANIDFDGSLVISLSSGQQINVGEVVPPELERQLVELRQGGGSAGSSGDVMGPTASTDNAIVRFDGTTGKLVQNSVVTIADTTGNMAGVGSLAVGSTLGVTGVSTLTAGAVIQGLTVGLGSGSVATNTAVGFRALLDNSSGTFNSALGYEALRYTTTGYSNTATGNAALHENISGYGNTASGSSALYYNTLGDSNVATGASSLQFNISGSSNTVSGAAAMQSNATGSRNTAIGALALITYTPPIVSAGAFVIATSYTILTVGTTNFVAIGASANTVGVVFTATGAGSGTGTASTNVNATNTAIGYGAGSTITTGTKNTIIGAYSGNQGSLDIRTASNYVVLSDGDGNPRAYWNGANATFNGGLAVTGAATVSTTLGVTGVSTLTAGAVIQGLTVGRGAGAVATNTAVGASALAANTTGDRSVAVGDSALATNSTGILNTAIGYQAAQLTSTSNDITAVGFTALKRVTASQNTAVGSRCAPFLTSGQYNVGVGDFVLSVASTSSSNTAIGSQTLSSTTTSGNSTAVGYAAGNLSTGIGNQFFGYNSGSAVTSGAKNVILGSYTGSAAPISATGSNNIVLSDGDGVVRQVIDSSGNVGIGITPAGAAKLEIKQALASQQGAWVYASANDSHARLFCDGTSVGLAASFTSTGSYLPMTFSTSATERARISSDGTFRVKGAGTAGSTDAFQVSGTAPASAASLDSSGRLLVGITSATGAINKFTVGAGLSTTNSVAVVNTVNANIDGLTISNWDGTSTSFGPRQTFANSGRGTFFIGGSDGAHNFDICRTWGTPDVRVDSSGNVLVGTTSSSTPNPGVVIQPVGAVIIGNSAGPSGWTFGVFQRSGTTIGSITQSGTTAVLYNTTSDQRLKENIVDAPEFGSVIDSIKVRSYDWKTDQTHQRAGFIAQELVTVAPEAVHQPENPEEMMAVDYSKLVPMLVKELQSLRARVAQLESKL